MTFTDRMKSFFRIAEKASKTSYVLYQQKPQWIRITNQNGMRTVIPVHKCNIAMIEEVAEKSVQTDPDYDSVAVVITLSGGIRYKLDHSLETIMKQLGLRMGHD